MSRRKFYLEGSKIGRLFVVEYIGGAGALYRTVCDCGREHIEQGANIRNRVNPSCGCYGKEVSRLNMMKLCKKTHGLSLTPEYKLWQGAKCSAKRRNIPFELTPSDVSIPDRCPVLGFELKKIGVKASSISPSLDRLDNSKGYTKDNVRVISLRANKLKSDATVKELEAIVLYMKGESN